MARVVGLRQRRNGLAVRLPPRGKLHVQGDMPVKNPNFRRGKDGGVLSVQGGMPVKPLPRKAVVPNLGSIILNPVGNHYGAFMGAADGKTTGSCGGLMAKTFLLSTVLLGISCGISGAFWGAIYGAVKKTDADPSKGIEAYTVGDGVKGGLKVFGVIGAILVPYQMYKSYKVKQLCDLLKK